MNLSFLPTVNATLNGLAALLLVSGFAFIRRGAITAHRRCMLAAFTTSCLFLASYLTHYAWRVSATGQAHTPYHGQGGLRTLYYSILISHLLLAMLVPVLAVWAIHLGLKRRYDRHRRLARFAWPTWLYVSVTGVLIYLMLYHWNPPAA